MSQPDTPLPDTWDEVIGALKRQREQLRCQIGFQDREIAALRARVKELERALAGAEKFFESCIHVLHQPGQVQDGNWLMECRCEKCKLVAYSVAMYGCLDSADRRWWEEGADG